MLILKEKVLLKDLPLLESTKYFSDMVKCVVDIDKETIALNAEMHCDLEHFLLESFGAKQTCLYGINIYYDGEIEFDSAINPPRNREAGFPRVGRYVADPVAREKIVEVVNKWIEL
jgi:hypothetical protein